jgi:hypothetical protein
VGAPHSFLLAPDGGRDLPVADSGGLPTPGAGSVLTGSHRDDGYDWKLWKEPEPVPQSILTDLDHGSLQIGCDDVRCRGLGELCKLIHSDNNVGAWCLMDLLVAAHIESIG